MTTTRPLKRVMVVKGAKLWVVLFWLTKYDGQAPLCEKMTGGAYVAVVGMDYRGLLEVEGVVGGGEPVPAATTSGTATTAVAVDIPVVVSAATVLRWHHRGWRAYWRWTRSKAGSSTLLRRSYRR